MKNRHLFIGLLLLILLGGNGRGRLFAAPFAYGTPDIIGEARETCASEQTYPSATILDAAGSWETTLEQDAQPGDIFLLRAGVYAIADQLRLKAGSAGQPIIIKPYDCQSVTLLGTIRPRSHNVLAGMHIELPKTSSKNWVIRLDGKNLGHIENVVIRNNTILGGQIDALRISDDVVDVTITGNLVDGGSNGHVIFITSENGIALPDQIYIANNRLTKSFFMTVSEDMLQVRDVKSVIFSHNTCADGWYMEQCVDIKSTVSPVIVYNNLFDGDSLHQGGPGEDGAAGCLVIHETDNDPDNHLIQDNYFSNCSGTTIRFASGDYDEISRAIVQRNVMIHPTNNIDEFVIPIWQALDVNFTNNTIVRGHLKLGDTAQTKLPVDTIIKNNIFYQTRLDDRMLPPDFVYSCSHNLLFQTVGTGFIHSPCPSLFYSDPLFVDLPNGDVHLQPISPAREAGVGGVDLGAYPFESFDNHQYLPVVVD